jgi:putative hemolysin
VRDADTLMVVGTYRLLNATRARKLGRLYSEGEFDLGRLNNIRGRIVEAGRACIHPDYRGGSVIMLLWSGLAEYMRRENAEFLVGCASISLADGGHNAVAVYQQLAAKTWRRSNTASRRTAVPVLEAGSGAEAAGAGAAERLYALGRMDLRRTGMGS